MRLSLLLVAGLCLLIGASRAQAGVRDVCIIGGGPSGLSAAAFAKDRGLDVLVFERQEEYGGNCNTEFFQAPFPGAPNWIDIGTAAFPSTVRLNELNGDTWSIDSVAIARRFAGNSSLTFLDLTNSSNNNPTYFADFARGVNYGLQQSTPQQAAEFGAALFRWLNLQAQYPGIQEAKWTSPTPAPLLISLSEAIEQYQLQPLFPLFSQLIFGGGLPDYSKVPLLYALAAIKPSLVLLLTQANVGFTVNGGCIKMYDGMVDYIGRSNVLLNVDVIEVERPQRSRIFGRGNNFVTVSYSSNSGSRCRYPQEVRCKNLVVAFPQTLDSIDFLQPDWREQQAFKDFYYHYIYTLELNVTGGIASQFKGFTIQNFDVSEYGYVPDAPALAYIQRGLPYGPAQAPLISSKRLTSGQLRAAIRAQTRNFPADLLTVNGVLASDAHDQYFPMLPPAALAQDPNPLQRIKDLNADGYRNTYWISTSLATPDTVGCWQIAYDVVRSIPTSA